MLIKDAFCTGNGHCNMARGGMLVRAMRAAERRPFRTQPKSASCAVTHPDGGVVPQLATAVTIQEVDVARRQCGGPHDPRVADLAGRQAHERCVAVPPPRGG